MSTWNWSTERRTAIGDVANQPLEYVAERLLESRKRAFDAEKKAQQLQAELDALKAAHGWIKTSERMPQGDVRKIPVVILRNGSNGRVEMADCYFGYWSIGDSGNVLEPHESVTHWMNLEPPK